MKEYTTVLHELLNEGIIEEDQLLKMLNNQLENYGFLSFSQCLVKEIQEAFQIHSDPFEIFKEKAKEKHIPFNRNTLYNWFYNQGPKKSQNAREMLYKIAFVLDYDVSQTIKFFEKVYKDRAFNVRKIDEFIYYFCFLNHYDYKIACELISKSKQIEILDHKHTIHTTSMIQDLAQLQLEDVIPYIQENIENFYTSNESAHRILHELLEDVLVKKEEVSLIKEQRISNIHSIMAQDLSENLDLIRPNCSMTSISSLLNVIYGENFDKVKQEQGKKFFKEAKLPKEILHRLPTKHTFSKKDPTYEELRKMIILLSSYKFWVINRNNVYIYDIEDYQYEINSYLSDANMPNLYPGNAFDWLFLYCSSQWTNHQVDPLEIFRELVGQSIEE